MFFRGHRTQLNILGNQPSIGGFTSSVTYPQTVAPMEGFAMSRTIPLTQGKVAIVDEADYEYLNQWRWYAAKGSSTYYARRGIWENDKTRDIRMHCVILNPPPSLEPDHINGDGLDNRRCNLRICTRSQNSMNRRKHPNCSSKYKGVSWYKRDCKWESYIYTDDRQKKHLGYFNDEEEAAAAYNTEARERFGEFAKPNVIDKEEPCKP